MTQRRALQQRLQSLGESGEIIRSMKNLAYMETHKLGHLVEHQRGVVEQILEVAADFLSFHPETLPMGETPYRVYLAIGSRRGFCGEFNERIESRLRHELAVTDVSNTAVIAVGRKLCLRLEQGLVLTAALDGADVAEELATVLAAIVAELDAQRDRHGSLALTVVYHRGGTAEPAIAQLLPPFRAQRGGSARYAFPPVLNLAPRDFLLELAGQYLFAALHALLLESLLAENERRLHHLEGAVRHLDDRTEEIQRHVMAIRQEEIIEEIEVILLNAASLDQPPTGLQAGEDERP